MRGPYPEIEPYASGWLDTGDGNLIYWETCGNPRGRPALVLHGGPGSGCAPWFRRLFDPAAYRVVLFDQRNCGRSRPRASDLSTELDRNTTQNLLGDIEQLRASLGIARWLVLGGSWGCVLALAYAEAFRDHVSELILFGVTTGRKVEVDWLFRGGVARFFPEQWSRLIAAVPPTGQDGDVVAAYARLLESPDPEVRRHAAEEWCLWESATPHWPPTHRLDRRFEDPEFAMSFARIVTHYVRHDLFLEDDVLLRQAGALSAIPGVLVNGRFDFQSPIANAYELLRAWPQARLVIVDEAGHHAEAGIQGVLVDATDGFR
ncbi:MAG TPA: prolyl aminopeptidase [Candidatus Limnocylindrales bacterium]|nr:prolyl aminopeptidase [Candidatus Limnocylindrales bacterium]